MRFIGVAILVLAVVIAVVGWRLTVHPSKSGCATLTPSYRTLCQNTR